jgi:hypothetical protein
MKPSIVGILCGLCVTACTYSPPVENSEVPGISRVCIENHIYYYRDGRYGCLLTPAFTDDGAPLKCGEKLGEKFGEKFGVNK